jgi:polyisoprenoid-binding protein YceI
LAISFLNPILTNLERKPIFMKKQFILLALTTLAAISVASAADFTVDPAHTSVGFSIRHMVSKVNGTFKDFAGDFSFDPKNPAAAKVNFTVQTASVDTQNEKRDTHLKSADFFEVEKFPTMTFKSTRVVPAGKNKYKVTGNFTLHGVTLPETFVVEYGGEMKDPWGNNRAGFSATTTIKRKDFGMVWNKTLDAGSVMLGDDVAISLQVEATENKPAAAAGAAPAAH